MGNNPFDRTSSGYEGLFGPRTMFYHLSPHNVAQENQERPTLVETLEVPVLESEMVGYGELWTVNVILLGVVWVMGKLSCVALKKD